MLPFLHVAGNRSRRKAFMALGIVLWSGASWADGLISFDIPSQPVATALDAYSTASGRELFYDGALAAGRRSNALSGRLSPDAALQSLLIGTGLVAHVDAAARVVLMPAPAMREPSGADRSYFAVAQGRLAPILCSHAETRPGNADRLLRVWIAASGTIARAELVDLGGGEGAVIDAAALHGVLLGKPPADMQQPLTLAIFAQASGQRSTCEAH